MPNTARYPIAERPHACDYIRRGQPGPEWDWCWICGDERDDNVTPKNSSALNARGVQVINSLKQNGPGSAGTDRGLPISTVKE